MYELLEIKISMRLLSLSNDYYSADNAICYCQLVAPQSFNNLAAIKSAEKYSLQIFMTKKKKTKKHKRRLLQASD